MCGNGVRCAAEFYTPTACGGTVSVSTRPLPGSGCCTGSGTGCGRSRWAALRQHRTPWGRGTGRRTAAGCAALRRRARVEGALCSRGQPALRTLYARAAARRGGAGRLGPCVGAPPGVPGRHQCGVCPAHQPHRAGCDGVGARQREPRWPAGPGPAPWPRRRC